jgi:tetratricopeptide (TPR) repeat protein
VHILQAWAVLESKYGRTDEARQLFARGLEVDPGNAYVCHAWGLMEQRLDNTDRARELFRAAFARAPQAKVCTALGELEACSGRVDLAREVFRRGIELCDEKSHIYMAWARVEEQVTHCYYYCCNYILSVPLIALPYSLLVRYECYFEHSYSVTCVEHCTYTVDHIDSVYLIV